MKNEESCDNIVNRHIKTKDDFDKIEKEMMKPFNGWYAYEIWEFLEYMVRYTKEKARQSHLEHVSSLVYDNKLKL